MSRDYTPPGERAANALERIADALEVRITADRTRMAEVIARARFDRWEYAEDLWPSIRKRELPQIFQDLDALTAAGFLRED